LKQHRSGGVGAADGDGQAGRKGDCPPHANHKPVLASLKVVRSVDCDWPTSTDRHRRGIPEMIQETIPPMPTTGNRRCAKKQAGRENPAGLGTICGP